MSDHGPVTLNDETAHPAGRRLGRRIPLRFWVVGGLVAALVLATMPGGVRGWGAHRVGDLTGGSKPADFAVGALVGLLPLLAVLLGALTTRGKSPLRRAWRMFVFGAVGFVVTYLFSPSPARMLTDSSTRHVFDRAAPSYLSGVLTGTVVWLVVLAFGVTRLRARRRRNRQVRTTAAPTGRTHRVIAVLHAPGGHPRRAPP